MLSARRLLVLGCCLTLTQLTFRLAEAEEVSLAGDYGEPQVIIPASRDRSLAHVSWPKVTVTPQGVIVVAAIAGEFHGVHGGGCPVVATSADGGRTFSQMQVLKRYHREAEYTAAGNCALGMAADGTVVLLSMAFNGDVSSTIDGWCSADGGQTWQPSDVSHLDQNQTGSVFGNIIQVPGKGLAVVGHYRKPAKPENGGLWMSWSTDNGKHWTPPEDIDLETRLRLVEPAVTYAEGQFFGLIRCDKNFYVEINSRDDGRRWTMSSSGMKSDYLGPHVLPSPCLVSDPAHPQRLLALVSERHAVDGPSDLLGRITLWQSSTTAPGWKKLGEVVRFPRNLEKRADLTYPWLAPLGEDRWYVVFYCGERHGPSDIYGLEIRIPE